VEADGADVSGAYSATGRREVCVRCSAKSSAWIFVLASGALARRVRRIGRARRWKTEKRTSFGLKPGRSDGGWVWLLKGIGEFVVGGGW
jgi:hypothetical protein